MGHPLTVCATIPPPRRITHRQTLLWWVLLLAGLVLVHRIQETGFDRAGRSDPGPGGEREAFVTLLLGRVSQTDTAALRPHELRLQLARLAESGYRPVRLADVESFFLDRRALSPKPVLLSFEEARRETIELVDEILADLGMHALVFVDVAGIESGHLALASRHQLRRMVKSGRWSLAVAGCRERFETDSHEIFSFEQFASWRTALEDTAGEAVSAIGCGRSWSDIPDAGESWKRALDRASFRLGFVARQPGANYRDEAPAVLRTIPIRRASSDPDALVSALEAHFPRREAFVDDFAAQRPAPGWILERGNARVHNGRLRLANEPGDPGVVLTLGGTERWRDASIQVELADSPSGEFWIYARRRSPTSFLRLGVVDGRIVFQRSTDGGPTRQLASIPHPDAPVSLRLRVVGDRALAFVGGTRLLERPATVPATLREGALSLASWNPDGEAAASISRFEAEPLEQLFALVEPDPDPTAWTDLRRRADELRAVSPRMLLWKNGRLIETQRPDRALQIFSRYHHLPILPALVLPTLPRARELGEIADALARWLASTGFSGANLVLPVAPAGEDRRTRELTKMTDRLRLQDRELLVTVRSAGPPDLPVAVATIHEGASPVELARRAVAPLVP